MRRSSDHKSNTPSFFVGTPLPEEKNDEDMTRKEKIEKNKFMPVWKQGVYDDKGKRLLHGAFKGGWDAGYNNSVGSKEGFTPTGMLVSSRTKKANIQRQSIDDFLDDEDREEMGIGGHGGLTTNSNFSFGSTGQSSFQNHLPIGEREQSMLTDFINLDEFIGAPTTSIGYTLLREMGWRESRAIGLNLNKKRKRIDDNDDPNQSMFLDDVKMIVYKKKDDYYGIGFDPFKMAPEFRSRRLNKDDKDDSFKKENQKKKNIIAMSDLNQIKRPKVHIDLYDDFDDEIDVIVKDKHRIFESNKEKSTIERMNQHHSMKKSGSLQNECPFKGFVVSVKIVKKEYFEPPDLQRDYKPMTMPGERRGHKLSSIEKPSQHFQQKGPMTPSLRSFILGEVDHPHEKKIKDENLVEKNEIFFKDDPEKSKRYSLWLKKLNGIQTEHEWDDGLPFDQKMSENQDFIRYWHINRPLSGYMAKKFTRSTIDDTIKTEKKELLTIPTPTEPPPLNRKIEQWIPDPLLLKRMEMDGKSGIKKMKNIEC